MKFWDSSAIIPLLVDEQSTSFVSTLYGQDVSAIVWWGSEIECVSALSRLEREGNLSEEALLVALQRLDALQQTWYEVQPVPALREITKRLLRTHPLRAADAMQLAAALLVCEHKPSTLEFVCLDKRLATAAQKEGFRLVSG